VGPSAYRAGGPDACPAFRFGYGFDPPAHRLDLATGFLGETTSGARNGSAQPALIASSSQARAYVQCRLAVRSLISKAADASSMLMPAK